MNRYKSLANFVQGTALVSLNESVRNVARMMAERNSSCAIVTLKDEPIGIVTECDILTRLVILGKDASKIAVSEVMSAPLWTVHSSESASETISLMRKNGFRRLVVRDGPDILGVISLNQIVGNRRENSIPLSVIEPTANKSCPFCGEVLTKRDELSRHIDSELALTY